MFYQKAVARFIIRLFLWNYSLLTFLKSFQWKLFTHNIAYEIQKTFQNMIFCILI